MPEHYMLVPSNKEKLLDYACLDDFIHSLFPLQFLRLYSDLFRSILGVLNFLFGRSEAEILSEMEPPQ